MKFVALLIFALVIFVGCGGREEKPQPTPQMLPDQLDFKPSQKGEWLSPNQREELKVAIGSRPQIVIPEVDLLFNKKRFTTNEFAAKEAKLKAQDIVSYNLMKEIQSNCTKSEPSFIAKGDLVLTLDGPNYKNVKVGTDLILKSSAQLAGENCPVHLDSNYDGTAFITEVNQANNTGVTHGKLSQDGQAILVSPKYVRLLKTRGLILSTKSSAVNIKQSVDNKIQYLHTFKGNYLSLVENIPVDGNAMMLIVRNKEGKKVTEFSLLMNVQTKKVSVVAEMYSKDIDNVNQTKRFYLNGYETSEREFDEIFGKHNPIISAKKTLAQTL